MNEPAYMHEDVLPPMTDEAYAAWFAHSWVPDGVGCRVGPVVEAWVRPLLAPALAAPAGEPLREADDPSALDPEPIELVRQLREALGMFAGAMPISPQEAWEQALQRARTLSTSVVVALLNEYEPQAEVAAERARCAALCEALDNDENSYDYRAAARWCAERIRGTAAPASEPATSEALAPLKAANLSAALRAIVRECQDPKRFASYLPPHLLDLAVAAIESTETQEHETPLQVIESVLRGDEEAT